MSSKILLAGIIGIFVVAGIFAWQYFGAPKETIEEGTELRELVEGGYSFKFPNNWERRTYRDISYVTPREKRTPEDIWIWVSIVEKEDLTVQPFYDLRNFFGSPGTADPVIIEGKTFYAAEEAFEGIRDIKYAIANEDGSQVGWVTLSIRQGRQRMDYYVPKTEFESELEIFHQVLSSFQFTEDTTKAWQTYHNAEFGFEFQYPETWSGPTTYYHFPGLVRFASPDYREEEVGEVILRAEVIQGAKIEVGAGSIPENIEWQEWVELGRGLPGNIVSSEFTSFAGEQAYRLIMEGDTREGISDRTYIRVSLSDQDRHREVIFTLSIPAKDRQEYERILEQILSTFRFVQRLGILL